MELHYILTLQGPTSGGGVNMQCWEGIFTAAAHTTRQQVFQQLLAELVPKMGGQASCIFFSLESNRVAMDS